MSDFERLVPIQEEENRLPDDYSVFDRGDRFSVINMVPPRLAKLIEEIPQEFLDMSEIGLANRVRPEPTLSCLRLSFWREYSDTILRGGKFDVNNVTRGICSRDYFNRQSRVPDTLCYIVTPPRRLQALQEEVLYTGLSKLRDFISTPFYDIDRTEVTNKSGEKTTRTKKKLNTQAVAEVRRVVELLDNRIHGSIINRAQIQTHTTIEDKANKAMPEDQMSILNRALALLEKEGAHGNVIEANPE